jgi:hypothetical protein
MEQYGDSFDLVFYTVLLCVMGVWLFFLIRYWIRRFSRWPTAQAVIQNGTLGSVPIGKGASAPAIFIGYAFVVQGERYGGYFIITGSSVELQKLCKTLSGDSIQIKYKPADPNVSLLTDYNDLRFQGLIATQRPDFMDRAPSFDLQDAIRRAPGDQ